MSVDFWFTLTKRILSKNQQGYVSPLDFNTFINQAQLMYLDYLLGEFQQYQYQKPVSRVQFGMNQQDRQSLTPLIVRTTLTIDGTGLSAYPSDFQQVDSMTTIDRKAIRYYQQQQEDAFVNSRIDTVATNPIYRIEDVGFRFDPITLGSATLSYVKTPPDIKWAYTTDSNGRPVYDPIASVDPVWYDTDFGEVMSRMLRMFGVSLQAQQVSQYANEIKNIGQ